MHRRDMLKAFLATASAGSLGATALRGQQSGSSGSPPAVPAPVKAVDPEPHANDVAKYPTCHYCNMDRAQFHHSRMLIHYGDDTVDPLCSLRCAAASLTINLRREVKAIWVGDNASPAQIKPLTDAETAGYLVGSSIRGVMTIRSKVAYSTAAAAEASRAAHGGDVVDFNGAVLAAYTDIAEAVSVNLKTRRERLNRISKVPQP